MADRQLAPGDVIDTPSGPATIQGCDRWPGDITPGATVSTLDSHGHTRFYRYQHDGTWTEVWARPLEVAPAPGCPACGADGTVNVDHHDTGWTARCIACGHPTHDQQEARPPAPHVGTVPAPGRDDAPSTGSPTVPTSADTPELPDELEHAATPRKGAGVRTTRSLTTASSERNGPAAPTPTAPSTPREDRP